MDENDLIGLLKEARLLLGQGPERYSRVEFQSMRRELLRRMDAATIMLSSGSVKVTHILADWHTGPQD